MLVTPGLPPLGLRQPPPTASELGGIEVALCQLNAGTHPNTFPPHTAEPNEAEKRGAKGRSRAPQEAQSQRQRDLKQREAETSGRLMPRPP